MGRPSTVIGLLAGGGLLLALIAFALPWWSITPPSGGAGAELDARPFDPGRAGDDVVSSSGVVGVGVLVLVGVVAAAGGLVLWGRAAQRGEPPIAPAPWLHLAGGALLLMGPLVAVATWPQGGLSFWGSSGGVSTSASIGWYLGLVAGALVAVAGIAGLRPSESPDPTAP